MNKLTKLKLAGLSVLTIICASACNNGSHSDPTAIAVKNKIIANPDAVHDLAVFTEKYANTDISKVALAVVGLRNDLGYCTGVAVKPNVFLTAAHCVISADNKSFMQKAKLILTDNSERKILDADNSAISFIRIANRYPKSQGHDGSDFALVFLNTNIFTNFVDADRYLEFNNQVVMQQDLISQAFNSYYGLGWGSQSKFQVLAKTTKNSLLLDSQNNELYWRDGLVGGNLIRTIQPKLTEDGDSGGPLFICSESNNVDARAVNNCILAGILAGARGQYGIWTSFVNPYVTDVLQTLNYSSQTMPAIKLNEIKQSAVTEIAKSVYGIRIKAANAEPDYCSGIAVASNQLLTAASCVSQGMIANNSNLELKFYTTAGKTKTYTNQKGIIFDDTDIASIRSADISSSYEHDLALVTLNDANAFTDFIDINKYIESSVAKLIPQLEIYSNTDLNGGTVANDYATFAHKNYFALRWGQNYHSLPKPRNVQNIIDSFSVESIGVGGSWYVDNMAPIFTVNKPGYSGNKINDAASHGRNKIIIPGLFQQHNDAGSPVFMCTDSSSCVLTGIQSRDYVTQNSLAVQPLTKEELNQLLGVK